MRTNTGKVQEHFSRATKLVDGEIETLNARAKLYHHSRRQCNLDILRHSVYVVLYFAVGCLMVVFHQDYLSLFTDGWLWIGQASLYFPVFVFALGLVASGEVLWKLLSNKKALGDRDIGSLVSKNRQANKALGRLRDWLVAFPETANTGQKLLLQLPKLKSQRRSLGESTHKLPGSGYILAGSSLFVVLTWISCLVLTVSLVSIAARLTIELTILNDTLIWCWAGVSGVIGAALGRWFVCSKVVDKWGYKLDKNSFWPLIVFCYILTAAITLGLLMGVLLLLAIYIFFIIYGETIKEAIVFFAINVVIALVANFIFWVLNR